MIHRERRSVTLAKFSYNPDGTISTLPWWSNEGVPQVGTLNPFVRVEAGNHVAWESGPATGVWATGVRTAQDDKRGVYVTDIKNGDFIKVRGVDFGSSQASTFTASVASGSPRRSIELHLDKVDGPEIGSLHGFHPPGGWRKWQARTTTVSGATGTRDLYFVFRGDATGQLFNFDYWKFSKKRAKQPKS